MRIAVHLPELSAAAAGGFTFQDDLVAALRDMEGTHGHSFVLISANAPADWSSFDRSVFSFAKGPSERRVRLRRACSALWPGADLLQRGLGIATALDARLRGLDVDLVWFATPYHCETDLPYIFTMWDLQHRLQPWFPEVSTRGRWEYREHWYSRAIQRASLIITPNSAGEAELQRAYGLPVERIVKLAHPTPAFALAAADTSRANDVSAKFGLTVPFLFYPAQFWPHKNHTILLQALATLKSERGLTPQLVLAGPDRGNLAYVRDRAQALGVGDQLRFVGFVEREDLIALYRSAAALVYVSYFGPENLPPLEAFALGCPVIAARVSGAEQQLGAAARLVDPTDASEIANAIEAIIVDASLRAELVERGRQRARGWTAQDYVRGLLREVQRFDAIRNCWPRGGRRPRSS